MNSKTKSVLCEIFGLESSWIDGFQRRSKMCPGFNDIYDYAKVLSKAKKEEDLQLFLSKNPKFLLGVIGSGGDTDFAFITKPPIGSKYKADFITLKIGQGGGVINFVEIEKIDAKLYTKQGTPSKDLQKAISQVTNWKEWIIKNQITYVPDLIKTAVALPQYPEISPNRSFKLRPKEESEITWKAFGGIEHPHFAYTIIIGRWSKLNEYERERLTFNNSQENTFYNVITYDQLARRAYDRPLIIF